MLIPRELGNCLFRCLEHLTETQKLVFWSWLLMLFALRSLAKHKSVPRFKTSRTDNIYSCHRRTMRIAICKTLPPPPKALLTKIDFYAHCLMNSYFIQVSHCTIHSHTAPEIRTFLNKSFFAFAAWHTPMQSQTYSKSSDKKKITKKVIWLGDTLLHFSFFQSDTFEICCRQSFGAQ